MLLTLGDVMPSCCLAVTSRRTILYFHQADQFIHVLYTVAEPAGKMEAGEVEGICSRSDVGLKVTLSGLVAKLRSEF